MKAFGASVCILCPAMNTAFKLNVDVNEPSAFSFNVDVNEPSTETDSDHLVDVQPVRVTF